MNINDLDSYEVVEVPEPKSEVDKPINLSDLSNYEVTQPVNEQDQSESILQTPQQAALTDLSPAISSGVSELLRQGAASSPVSSLAESLAFRGAGGMSSPIGIDLVKEQAISKGIGNINPSSVVEPTVNPKKVGRAILDESLLGPLGLGTKEGNLTRATEASIEAAKPTNDLLRTLTNPISKEDIYNRTKQILDIPNLDMAVPENKMIVKALEKRINDLQGFQLPIDAEETKRQLQGSVNYQSDKSAAKSAVSKAQARATREQTEAAADLVGKLDEFKKLKSKSGNIQVAKDIIESGIKPSNGTFPGSGLVNMVADLATKKTPAIGATALDTVGKVAKSKFGKALPYAIGALVGGVPAVASEVVGEAMDVEPSGATMESPAAQEDYLYESGIRDPKKIEEAKRLYNFKQGLPNQGRMDEVPSAYDKPETKQYKENVLKAKERGQLKDNYVTPLADKASDLEKLQQLHEQFRSMSGKGAEAMASTIDKSINGTDEEKIKSDFVLKQNQAIRNKLY